MTQTGRNFMKNKGIIACIALGVSVLGVVPYTQNQSDIQITDSTLRIPEIQLTEQLIPANIHGKTFEVPDYRAAYYQPDSDTTFIYGHSSTVFQRLKEIPHALYLGDTEYTLSEQSEQLKENINMNNILARSGVTLMTCSGEDDKSRLILTYALNTSK